MSHTNIAKNTLSIKKGRGKMKTKKQKIKEHLEAGNVITQRDAYELSNHTRLAAVIHELRNDEKNPMDIRDVSINEVNESGERVNYSEYYLKNPGGNKNQISMFSDDPKTFRAWLDAPPKFDEKKHIR